MNRESKVMVSIERAEAEGYKLLSSGDGKYDEKLTQYRGLNYEYMKWYIGQYETQEKKDSMLKALDELIDISKCHSTGKRYATIRNWFLDNYPAVKEFGMPKADNQDATKTTLKAVA